MTRRKLSKIAKDMNELRSSPKKARKLVSIAKKLGRVETDRGKEPTYINADFPELRPLTIPQHGGRDLAIGTQGSILDQLQDDIDAWEMRLDE